ncbi:hypothetical protein GCM10010145_34450 [Streptomyces ruber]|uniref:Uncharacterized protein n=2 Tax=Streptomyces TaxID=1883 RepID=A0A918BEM4_9ACTN|nr:hypothetical protein [Streptomyces ruber]GGQ61409.1 hypothetical protein GCM10010145_34450 [Streptomyces ruber]
MQPDPKSRSRSGKSPLPDGEWSLSFCGRTVSRAQAQEPLVLHLLAEDICYQFAVYDWSTHRPALRHPRAWLAWRRKKRRLNDKRDRLREIAAASLPH